MIAILGYDEFGALSDDYCQGAFGQYFRLSGEAKPYSSWVELPLGRDFSPPLSLIR